MNLHILSAGLLLSQFLKTFISENIAHCRDEKLIEVYLSSWEQEVYLNISEANYLFIETGLPEIT